MSTKNTIISAAAVVGLSGGLAVTLSQSAAAGPWRDMHGDARLGAVIITRAGGGACVVSERWSAPPTAAARAEGYDGARWRQQSRVPCAAVRQLLAGAEIIEKCNRPTWAADPRPDAADAIPCEESTDAGPVE